MFALLVFDNSYFVDSFWPKKNCSTQKVHLAIINVIKNPARCMLPGILVNFFDRCPYLMGNRFMQWQGNIAINILFLSLLLLLGFLFQIEEPQPTIIASEDQGTAEVIVVVHNFGYMGPFPVYLG